MKTFPTSRNKKGTIVGIEITSHVIRMVRLRRLSGGRFSFESSRSVPIDPHFPVGSADYIAALKKGFKEFCGAARGIEIWTSLGAERVRIHHLKIPRMSKAQLSGAVYWAMKREESFDDDETVFDFELAPEPDPEPDAPYSVTGFLAPREDLDKIRRLFAQTGYPLTGLVLPLYSLRNLFHTEWIETSLSPVMVTHIGHRSSSVGILAEGRSVMTRDIPIGLNSFAEILTRELNPAPTLTEATRLVLRPKSTHSTDQEENHWNEENVFLAIRPTLERMARQIERALEYCQTTYALPRVERVYLAGTIAAIPRFTDFLNQQISAEVSVMDPLVSDRLEAAPAEDRGERAAFALPLSLALSDQGRTPRMS